MNTTLKTAMLAQAAMLTAALTIPAASRVYGADETLSSTPSSTPSSTSNSMQQQGSQQPPSFTELDTNHDGYISKEEAAKSTALTTDWSKADVDKDGKLDLSEFSAFEYSQGGGQMRTPNQGEANPPAPGMQAPSQAPSQVPSQAPSGTGSQSPSKQY